jgi:hypothetical protein
VIPLGDFFTGRQLHRFRRWLDRMPDSDPSRISLPNKIGRLALAALVMAMLFLPVWAILK